MELKTNIQFFWIIQQGDEWWRSETEETEEVLGEKKNEKLDHRCYIN